MPDWFFRVVLDKAATSEEAAVLAERVGSTFVDSNEAATEVSGYVAASSAREALNTGLDLVGSVAASIGFNARTVEVEAKIEVRRIAQLTKQGVPELVGMAEVQEILGVNSRQHAGQLAERKDFPDPVAELKGGRVWLRSDIVRFRDRWRAQRH